MKRVILVACALLMASAAQAQTTEESVVPDDSAAPEFVLEFVRRAQLLGGFRIVDAAPLSSELQLLDYGQHPVRDLSHPGREMPVTLVSRLPWTGSVDAVLTDAPGIRRDVLIDVTRQAESVSSPELQVMDELLSLNIDGDELLFTIVEAREDPLASDVRHVTGVTVNQEGYVRFAIDMLSGLMVGTVQVNHRLYRILPGQSDLVDLVFRIPPRERGRDRYLALTRFIAMPEEVQQLEQRHLVAEALADMQPKRYMNRGAGHRVEVESDPESLYRIADVDVDELEDPTTLTRMLSEIAPLINARGDEDYEIASMDYLRDGNGWAIVFRQLINDIPINHRHELRLGPEGGVLYLRVRVWSVADLFIEDVPMTLEEATQLAVAGIEQRAPGSTIQIEDGEIVYKAFEGRLVPVGRFAFHVTPLGSRQQEPWGAVVRIDTGEATIQDSASVFVGR